MAELGRYFRTQRIGALCLVLATLLLLGLRTLSLPLSEPRADQSQFLGYAYNMLKYGQFSVNRSDRPRPDQMREPGYPLLLAAGLLLHPGLDLDEADARCVTEGKGGCVGQVTWLKLVNLVFLGLSGLAVFAALLALTGRPVAAWAGYLWVMLSASYAQYAGLFFSEVVVGFLIVALSLRLWRLAGQPPDRRQWFLAGLLLGALVMVKATFYYLAPLLAVVMAAHAALRRAVPLGQAAILGLIFLGGTLALTVPWHARNLISTGTTSLAGRAGLVLTVRANYDELPAEDLMAAAALFTPHNTAPRAYLASRWLTPEADARLTGPDNPRDGAFTRLEELRQQTRLPVFGPELDDMLKREAMTRIGEHWPQHLRATLLFGYRGLFAERGYGFAASTGRTLTLGDELLGDDLDGWFLNWPILSNLMLFLPAFVAFTFCVVTARWPLVILMLPAAYLYGLQALMTHYIPRYSAPLIPMLVVIAVLVGTAMWDRIAVMLRGWQAGRREADATSPVPSQLRAYLSRRPVAGVCLVAMTLVLLGLRAADMPVAAPVADQSQYLAYAYNLATRGKFSIHWGGSTKPDQRREPGYPLLLSAAMILHPGLHLRSVTASCIATAEPRCADALFGLKLVNLLFFGLSGIAVFAAVLVLTSSPMLAWIGFLMTMLSISYGNFAVRFFPEVIVGFLLVGLSMRLWRLAVIPPDRRAWYLTGLLLGAVVMLKATFYYLTLPLAAALAVHARWSRGVRRREAVLLGMGLVAGTLTLTVPWHVRNMVSTGTTSLSGRGGLVLTVRANYNELSPAEMLAAAADFSPAHSRPEQFFAQRWLTPELTAKLNGPDNPRARGYARAAEFQTEFGYDDYDPELDSALKREAVARIAANWPAHLRGTLLFGYRGLFVDRGLGFDTPDGSISRLGTQLLGFAPSGWLLYSPVLLSFVLFGTAFAAFAYCVATARWPLIFLMLPAAYLYAIQAFMTHYIPRYGVALIPMLVVILMLAVAATASRLIASASR